MKKILFFICIFCALTANAQTYLISFTGSGASTTVNSVKVENLTSGASLTLNEGDILRLNVLTGVNSIYDKQSSELKIYPNPMTDNTTLEIFPSVAGNAVISILDMTGKKVAQIQSYLENLKQSFRLSGLKNGFYLINVKGDSYQFSGKLLSNGKSDGTISIDKVNNIAQVVKGKTERADNKGVQATVDMTYTSGDRLKFTGISGIYSTVLTDIPLSDKIITFNFIACTDGDNNNYPVVEIGDQVWMAENLKTTKYKDGTTSITNDESWAGLPTPAYCWYDNNIANKDVYGALYNWYTVNTDNLCPMGGWHVPDDSEWNNLTDYLEGLNVAGGKLKETGTKHWTTPNTGATNETGFTALPGGSRLNDGEYIGIGYNSYLWSSTVSDRGDPFVWFRDLLYNYTIVDRNYGTYWPYGFSVRCIQRVALPNLTTTAASSITQTSALCGGIVTSYGGDVTVRGVCWNTSGNPTIADNYTLDGTGTGIFTSNLIGLTINTKYYVKAFATNNAGTNYGNEIFFATRGETGTVSDIDGNSYPTIEIGTQVWMAENLKTTKYENGTSIPLITENTEWINLITPGYCWYNNDEAANKATYGALYNWYTVSSGNLCPTGWHVPTFIECTTLDDYLGGYSVAGGKVKETGTTHWKDPNTGATNETGFTALPGGGRYVDESSIIFGDLGDYGDFWSSTEYSATTARIYYMVYDYNYVVEGNLGNKQDGFSVRCVKDN